MKFQILCLLLVSLKCCVGEIEPEEITTTTTIEPSIVTEQVLLGGLQPVDSNDDMVQNLTFLINDHKFNKTLENENIWLVTSVKNVSTQLVSGILWHIDVVLSKVNCIKNDVDSDKVKAAQYKLNIEESACPVVNQTKSDELKVHYEIISKPWLNILEIHDEKVLSQEDESSPTD